MSLTLTAGSIATTTENTALCYHLKNWGLGINVMNLLDPENDDLAHYFESRLQNGTGPVADMHFHPVLPQTTVKWLIKSPS